MSDWGKFLLVFGIIFGIVLVFLAIQSPYSFLIAMAGPVVGFIIVFAWKQRDEKKKIEDRMKKNDSSMK
ncbi:hypothetical protein GOP80_05720 [Planococcaceae bacterium Storch 2/2-2]|nr:hypothetical protein [Planococcaceae bacterium Storch 2/2-2]